MNASDCLKLAKDCLERAEVAISDKEKAGWLYMADSWMKLARTIEPRIQIANVDSNFVAA
jgi:hypothetical protein